MMIRTFVVAIVLFLISSVNVDGGETFKLRVMSYNIHHGAGVDGKLDLKRIAKVILAAKPDIVALQEVDRRARRTSSIDQPTRLAELTEMKFAFGANIPLQGGHYGNAVLSKFNISSFKNVLLPNLKDGEQRGAVVAQIVIPGRKQPLRFIATHFDHRRPEEERIASAKAVNSLVPDKHPSILAGDLNAVPTSKTLKELGLAWTRTNENPLPTIPVKKPNRQIDFILVSPAEKWKIIKTQVLDESVASDHRAIVADLELHLD